LCYVPLNGLCTDYSEWTVGRTGHTLVVGRHVFKETLGINGRIILKLVIRQAQDSMQGRDDVNTVRDHIIPHNTGELSDQLNDYQLLEHCTMNLVTSLAQ